MRDHRKLKAFELADQLVLQVYAATRSFPGRENFGLTSQLRRAAISIASNIVEGCARSTKAEYIRFLEIAYGSAKEVEYQISLAHRLGYLATPMFEHLNNYSVQTSKILNGLICSLRKPD